MGASPIVTSEPGSFPKVAIDGLEFDAITADDLHAHVLAQIRKGVGGWVMTPNIDHLRLFRRDPEVRAIFDKPSLTVADGTPVVWASRLQGQPLPSRVAGSELVLSLTERAATERRRLFLLGGAPGTAQASAGVLEAKFPGIEVVDTACPPVGFENDEGELEAIESAVRAADPDLVYVGLPFPKADRLIIRLRAVVPQAWFLGVGVSFSFVSGDLNRAPVWMRRWGLEWLHRLLNEPTRLFQRYVVHGIPFTLALFARIGRARFLRRFTSESAAH